MRRKFILLPLIAASLSLVGCASGEASSSSEASFHIATFHLNYETASETYQTLVVNKGANLVKPSDPKREEYLFKAWTTDKEGANAFVSFDAPLSADIDLYASWTPISEVDEATQLSMLISSLKEASEGANHAYIKQTQVQYYPMSSESALTFYQEKDITRYKDISVAKFYESDTSSTVLAEQQYFYDDTYFYNLLKDYEDSSGSSKTTAKFSKDDIDSFLNVDFFNVYGSDLRKSLQLLTDKSKVRVPYGDDDSSSSSSESTFVGDYSFEMSFDPTQFSVAKESYTFSVAYETYTNSSQFGWITNSYSTTANISFLNGKIKRAIVQMGYYFAFSEGVYSYSISSETSSFDYGDYADFTGSKWNPADFKDSSSN